MERDDRHRIRYNRDGMRYNRHGKRKKIHEEGWKRYEKSGLTWYEYYIHKSTVSLAK